MKTSYAAVAHEDANDETGDQKLSATAVGGDVVRAQHDHKQPPFHDRPTAAEHSPEPHVPANIRSAQRLIYFSHFVSQFSECAWYFAVVLFLAAISDYQSMLLVSTYYLTTYLVVMIFGAPFGNFLDRSNRLKAARLCIGIENCSVLVATVCCCWLLTKKTHDTNSAASPIERTGEENVKPQGIPQDTLSIVLVVGIHVFGSLAQLLNQGFVVAIERDWIVVLSQQTPYNEAWLSGTNVRLRQIYLSCKVISPTFAGWIVGEAGTSSTGATSVTRATTQHFCDLHGAAVLVGILCISSLVVEYVCTVQVYNLVPELALPQKKVTTKTDSQIHMDTETLRQEEDETGGSSDEEDITLEKSTIWSGFRIYWEQSIVCAGLSLAFINSNALCFGGTMTTFLLWKGMPIEEVGFWRGVSSGVGLLGTFAYNFSTKHTTVVNTGAWSVVYLFTCLTVACSSFLINDYHTGVYILVIGTAASRIGLWVFDISVTLLYQEMVPDGVRSWVGGTQQSLNSCFTMLSGCLGLIFRKPEQFYVIALAGYICIGISMLLYIVGLACFRPH